MVIYIVKYTERLESEESRN